MKRLSGVVLSFVLLSANHAAFASDMSPEDVFFMDIPSVVTSVSKREQTQDEAPGIVTIITARDMEEMGITTVEDALKLVPGYEVQFGPRRKYTYTRGIINAALVLIDGTPIVNPSDGDVSRDQGIVLDMVERIEVIRGPGGVLWGPTAFVGIVNIVTKQATSPGGTMTVKTGYGSYETRKASILYDKKQDTGGVLLNYSEERTLGPLLSGKDLRSPYTGYWGDGYINTNRKEDTFREFTLKYSYDHFTFYGRWADQENWFQIDDRGRTVAKNFDMLDKSPVKELSYLTYDQAFEPVKVNAKIWTMLRESFLTGMYSAPVNAAYSGNTQWVYDTWRARQTGGQIELTFDKLLPRNTILTGASYIDQRGTDIWSYDKVIDFSGGPEAERVDPAWFFGHWPVTDDGFGWVNARNVVQASPGEQVRSYYMTDSWTIRKNLTLSGGIRYDHNSMYDPITRYSDNVVWEFRPGHFVKYIYAEGFRPATWEQKTSRSLGGGDLKPEQSWSHDFQYNGKLTDRLSIFVNHAVTFVDNLVTLVIQNPGQTPVVQRYRNSGATTATSIEAGGKYYFPANAGYCFANYNYKRVDDMYAGELQYLADHIATLGMYWRATRAFASSMSVHFESEKTLSVFPEGLLTQTNNPALRTQRTFAPITTINAGVHYKFERLKASLFVYNMLDASYEVPPYSGLATAALPAPRRSAMLNVSIDF